MIDRKDEIRALLWMIRHYLKLADDAWSLYKNLIDCYLVYDHYMVHVQFYENKLDELYE